VQKLSCKRQSLWISLIFVFFSLRSRKRRRRRRRRSSSSMKLQREKGASELTRSTIRTTRAQCLGGGIKATNGPE
jgi:hypothetical protein